MNTNELQWWSNTVRPTRTAELIGHLGPVAAEGGRIVATLSKGRSSSGYHTDYTAVETWWVLATIHRGAGTWSRGSRYSGRRAAERARHEFDELAGVLREEAGVS